MLKNMKIGSRLGFGFGVVMVLMAIIGIFSIMQISKLDSAVELMVKDRFPKTVAANDIIDNVNLAARALRNMALVKSPQDIESSLKKSEIALRRF